LKDVWSYGPARMLRRLCSSSRSVWPDVNSWGVRRARALAAFTVAVVAYESTCEFMLLTPNLTAPKLSALRIPAHVIVRDFR